MMMDISRNSVRSYIIEIWRVSYQLYGGYIRLTFGDSREAVNHFCVRDATHITSVEYCMVTFDIGIVR